jgi:hypothetical protein
MLRAQRLLAGLRGVDRRRLDALVGLLLAIEIELQVWLNGSGVRSALGGIVLSLAVAFRRRWSVQGVLAVLTIMAVQAALGVARANHQDQVATIPGLLLLFYGLGAFASERKSLWTLGLALVVV